MFKSIYLVNSSKMSSPNFHTNSYILATVDHTNLYAWILKTGLATITTHSITWQLKTIQSVQRPKKPISDAGQYVNGSIPTSRSLK